MSSEHFDIVHAHDGRAQNISALASAGLPLRRVASRQVAFPPRRPLIHRWKYAKTCHGIIANSEAVRGVLIAAGIPAANIEVIPPGIELPAELPNAGLRAEARARWGFSSEDFVIGHAGAFTREKGQDVALEAARLFAPRLPHARMLLVGDGPERRNPTEGIAILPGFLDDLNEFYAALDLFIMPSRSEGWGLTALRAMANGLAVIATDVGGLRELVEQGKTGWLVPPDVYKRQLQNIVLVANRRNGQAMEMKVGGFGCHGTTHARTRVLFGMHVSMKTVCRGGRGIRDPQIVL